MRALGLLLLLAARRCGSDSLLSAGNWTHSTSMFSELHFVPGYNAAGEWDILTGGNWTPTNHTDLRMVGDAAVYLCPCPLPPCELEDGPPKPGFNTSVYTCVDDATHNTSHVVCSIFHRDRTNVTCVTPQYAITCEVPAHEPECRNLVTTSYATITGRVYTSTCEDWWWNNTEAPSHSWFNDKMSAVSCIVRGMEEQSMARYANFTSARVLHEALFAERCAVECRQICQTVCVQEHLSVYDLFEQLGAWRYDPAVEQNLREFEVNGTLYHERSPAQYRHGATAATAGQRRQLLNRTCSVPTLDEELERELFRNGSLLDMMGRQFDPLRAWAPPRASRPRPPAPAARLLAPCRPARAGPDAVRGAAQPGRARADARRLALPQRVARGRARQLRRGHGLPRARLRRVQRDRRPRRRRPPAGAAASRRRPRRRRRRPCRRRRR